jgi:hypothetical protein
MEFLHVLLYCGDNFRLLGSSCPLNHGLVVYVQEGLVSLMVKKKSSEVEAGRATLISSLSGLLGSPPILPTSTSSVGDPDSDPDPQDPHVLDSDPNPSLVSC